MPPVLFMRPASLLCGSLRVARDVRCRAVHAECVAGRTALTQRKGGVVTIGVACARRRARREHRSVVRAAEAGRSRRARLATIGHERGALALDAGDARRVLKSYLRAVV